jgi:hypothetical protein
MTGELQVREDTPVVYLSGEPTPWLASGSSRLAIRKSSMRLVLKVAGAAPFITSVIGGLTGTRD